MSAEEQSAEEHHSIPMEGEDIMPKKDGGVLKAELFEFHGEDITEEENGGIIRRIVTKGKGYNKPNEGASVEVVVQGTYEGCVFDEREMKFDIGDGEGLGLTTGVEKAIMAMEQGEESLFTIKPKYGFGKAGHTGYNIPGEAILEYRIQLTKFEKEPPVMKAIKEACKWLEVNEHLFQGLVCRPPILDKEEEDALVALTAYNGFFDYHDGDEHEIREPFLFGFSKPADMEIFMSEVRDKREVRVSAALFE